MDVEKRENDEKEREEKLEVKEAETAFGDVFRWGPAIELDHHIVFHALSIARISLYLYHVFTLALECQVHHIIAFVCDCASEPCCNPVNRACMN